MLGKAALFALLTAGLVVAAGCHHDKYGLKSQFKEEVFLPTDEPRFNNPPSAEYRKRPPKPEDKSLMGGGKMGGPGLNPGGF